MFFCVFPVCVREGSAHTQPGSACASARGYRAVAAASQPKVTSGEG